MNNNKIKIYRMPLSRIFSATHPRKGEETHFEEKIFNEVYIQKRIVDEPISGKIHTCRNNYNYWYPRIQDVINGMAVLVLYQWTGIPYKSKTKNVFVFGNEGTYDFMNGLALDARFKDSFFVYSSGVGIQLLDCDKPFAWEIDEKPLKYQPEMIQLANNDGLSYEDFDKWFDVEKATGQKAIIHFTNFRY